MTMRCRRSQLEVDASRQDPVNRSPRCVEKLCGERNTSSTSRSRSPRLSAKAGARTVRRKDLTMGEARTWCAKHTPPDMQTGQSTRACLCREVPTDHEAHGQRGGGHSRAELCSKSFGGRRPRKSKQNTRSMVASALRLITRAGRRRARRSGAGRWRGTGQSSKPRAAHEKPAVHERTVRQQAIHGAP